MSLAIDLTTCQSRLAESGRAASALVRELKGKILPAVYDELMLRMCEIAAEYNQFKVLLGVMRMAGEMEQRPPEVTVERLELAGCVVPERDRIHKTHEVVPVVPAFPAHAIKDQSAAFARELQLIGDDTLQPELDRNVSVYAEEAVHG